MMNERTRDRRRNLTEAVEEYREAPERLREIAASRGLTQKAIREASAAALDRPQFPPQCHTLAP